ncbi:MAG: DMT family transporter [Anaerolineae bacterium]|nr:DMT family transporter [Anaerolineae bacterium]MCB0253573.1 DMT family transporter [Anaerolineae bacterium]
MPGIGELAALATAVLWSFTGIQFTFAGRRVGSPAVNRMRLAIAVFYLSLAHLVLNGQWWPLDASRQQWFWLGLSGIVGLAIGDAFLFQAYVTIGPRRAAVIMTTVPVMSTVLAWLWFGEVLSAAELLAMSLTLFGVAWVVSERRNNRSRVSFTGDEDRRVYLIGVLLALGGAAGQSLGLLLSKKGLEGGFPPLSATVIRMVVATAAIWLVTLLRGRAPATIQALRDRRALVLIAAGAFTGPFLGVWNSMIAVQNAPVGIASTLMSLSPVMLIPLSHYFFGERVTSRAILGTLIALTGTALIFLT